MAHEFEAKKVDTSTFADLSVGSPLEKVLKTHYYVNFAGRDLHALLAEYADDADLHYYVDDNYSYFKGHKGVRNVWEEIFMIHPKNRSTFSIKQLTVTSNVGFVVWEADTPLFKFLTGVDTFVFNDQGKIQHQTFTGTVVSKT